VAVELVGVELTVRYPLRTKLRKKSWLRGSARSNVDESWVPSSSSALAQPYIRTIASFTSTSRACRVQRSICSSSGAPTGIGGCTTARQTPSAVRPMKNRYCSKSAR